MPWWGWVIVVVVGWIVLQMIRAEMRGKREADAILQHLQSTEAWVMSAHAAMEPGLMSGKINAAVRQTGGHSRCHVQDSNVVAVGNVRDWLRKRCRTATVTGTATSTAALTVTAATVSRTVSVRIPQLIPPRGTAAAAVAVPLSYTVR